MARWRKVMVWLVLLWLPAQGFAAGLMPFACHTHAGASVSAQDAHHHEAHAHHGHEQPPAADDSANHELTCDDCSLCQMCGALALPGTALKNDTPLNGGIAAALPHPLQSFIPSLPHRPPRLLLA